MMTGMTEGACLAFFGGIMMGLTGDMPGGVNKGGKV
jgi:hypothetical protein